jgi:hypothetical protein
LIDTTETKKKRPPRFVDTLRIQTIILVLLIPPTVLVAPAAFDFLLSGFIQKERGYFSLTEAADIFRLLFLQEATLSVGMVAGFTILALLLQVFYWQAACFLWRKERRQYFYFIMAAAVNAFLASNFKAFFVGADIATHILCILTIPAGALIAVIHLFLLKCYHRRWPLK